MGKYIYMGVVMLASFVVGFFTLIAGWACMKVLLWVLDYV